MCSTVLLLFFVICSSDNATISRALCCIRGCGGDDGHLSSRATQDRRETRVTSEDDALCFAVMDDSIRPIASLHSSFEDFRLSGR